MLHGNKRIIKHKIGLLDPAEKFGDISKTWQLIGLSREIFYRYKSAMEEWGVDCLTDKICRKTSPKNRGDGQIASAAVEDAVEQPAYGQTRDRQELIIHLSPRSKEVGLRHKLVYFKDHLESLQTNLDAWLGYYNGDRTHQEKMCCSRITVPEEVFAMPPSVSHFPTLFFTNICCL